MDDYLVNRLLFFIPLLLSLTVHEWAHAWSAWKLGDDTAQKLGRMTLNPIVHIDPIGTLLLPLMGVPFGWAKPVPVNPLRFRSGVSMRMGMLLTALAGPISNVIIAISLTITLGLVIRFHINIPVELHTVMHIAIFLNAILAVFNMLPIPPLDGSRVADGLMPSALRPAWNGFCQLAPLLLAAVILVPLLMGKSLLTVPLAHIQAVLDSLRNFVGGV